MVAAGTLKRGLNYANSTLDDKGWKKKIIQLAKTEGCLEAKGEDGLQRECGHWSGSAEPRLVTS